MLLDTKANLAFSSELLADMVNGGYVRQQTHPTLPLVIYNYTDKAQYEGVWNSVTRKCRGLILHAETGECVARPFPKFFNYGEQHSAPLNLGGEVTVTDKLDGSLGILHPGVDGWEVATRGSFTSDQARHATRVWRERYQNKFFPAHHLTYLFEIVYPENRIVVDYGGMDDLVHLGCVNIRTGVTYRPDPDWPGPSAEEFPYSTFAEALAAEPRPNSEGLVVHFRHADERIKLKQDDYVALHKIVTGLNERVVWERIGAGETVEDICGPLPDEFHTFVKTVAARLEDEKIRILTEAAADHENIVASLPEGWTRREYAQQAKQSQHRALLFLLLDGKDPSNSVWRNLKPSGDVTREDVE